jgi:hypothetical protein
VDAIAFHALERTLSRAHEYCDGSTWPSECSMRRQLNLYIDLYDLISALQYRKPIINRNNYSKTNLSKDNQHTLTPSPLIQATLSFVEDVIDIRAGCLAGCCGPCKTKRTCFRAQESKQYIAIGRNPDYFTGKRRRMQMLRPILGS